MQTVHPSIILGSYLWDEERLPRDEFDIRMQAIRDAIDRDKLAAVFVYGDARDHEALAFFSNFIPRMRWAMAMFPAKGEPLLLASMSSRDVPAMKTMTWIADVKSGWEWRWFEAWIANIPDGGRIGIIGHDLMTPILSRGIETRMGQRTLQSIDEVDQRARRAHRPREIAVVREAARIAQIGAAEIAAAFARGDDVEHAALAGERAARNQAAHDVRTLVSRDGGRTLQPYRARFIDRPQSLLAYIAVKFQGYWGESYVSVGAPAPLQERCDRALEAAIEMLRPGVGLGEIAKRIEGVLEGAAPHPVLSGSFGRRMGLSLNEGAEIRRGAEGLVEADTVYGLHVGAVDANGGAVSSAMARLKKNGTCEVILRSGGQGAV